MITMATLAVVAFVFAYVFVVQKQKEARRAGEVAKEMSEKKLALPKLECGQMNDQDAHRKAIEDGKIDFCGCIKEDGLKSACQDTMMDSDLAKQALAQMNKSICDGVKNEERKENCLSMVNQSVAYLKANDPQRLAALNSENHNVDYAISSYEELLKENPNKIENLISLALSYAEKGLKEQEQGESQVQYVNKAFEAIEKAKAIDNNSSEAYRVEAYINEIKPDYAAAINLYNKAIELDQKNISAYVGRGHANRMVGALELAIEDFNKAAEMDTDRNIIHIYTNLCNLEYSRSNYQEAIKYCKIVTEKTDVDSVFQSSAYQNMAMIFLRNNDYVQAKNYLLKAKALTPADSNLFVTLAKLNIFENKYQESEMNARKAIELSPTKTSGQLALSQALYMENKFNESILAAQKGLTMIKDDVSLLAPSKPAVERDLNYSIANNYRETGDFGKQKEYEQKGEAAFNNLSK